jgi:surface antigen
VLRTHYTCQFISNSRRWGTVLAAPLLLAGCSLSMWGDPDVPATTGSIADPVEVQQPLPPTLAFSDATKIGQAASAALWQATGTQQDDWVNARTGSSGTLTREAAPQSEAAGTCRPFSTTVTSLGGVHRYSGTVCRAEAARTVVQLAENVP